MDYIKWLWTGGGIALVNGAVLLLFARKADAKNYIIQVRLPSLSLLLQLPALF